MCRSKSMSSLDCNVSRFWTDQKKLFGHAKKNVVRPIVVFLYEIPQLEKLKHKSFSSDVTFSFVELAHVRSILSAGLPILLAIDLQRILMGNIIPLKKYVLNLSDNLIFVLELTGS